MFNRTLMALFILCPRLHAHDLWLVPPDAVANGKPARIHAISGSKFPKGDNAPDPAKFAKRTLLLPDGSDGKLASASASRAFCQCLDFQHSFPLLAG